MFSKEDAFWLAPAFSAFVRRSEGMQGLGAPEQLHALGPESQVRRRRRGQWWCKGSYRMKRLAIYAHYDRNGEIKPFVVHYLKALSEQCSRVEFRSTASLSDEELDKVSSFCDVATTEKNVGYDFGVWRHAIERTLLSEYDELVLTNSSVYGPLSPLCEMFGKMEGIPCDFWGVTDSHELDWHLQSYFLVFRAEVLHSEVFLEFWKSVLPYASKRQVIRSYEIGLSCFLQEHGFVGEALVCVDDLFLAGPLRLVSTYRRENPTKFYALRCIEHGMPFVKAEVLRDNPGRVSLRALYRAIEKRGYERDLIVFDRPVSKPRTFIRRVVDALFVVQ